MSPGSAGIRARSRVLTELLTNKQAGMPRSQEFIFI